MPAPTIPAHAERSNAGITARVTYKVSSTDDGPHASFGGALAWATVAEQLSGTESWQASYDASLQGIEELGRSYKIRGTKDDTGMKLAAASHQAKGGDLKTAAMVAGEVLRLRIDQYSQKHADVAR